MRGPKYEGFRTQKSDLRNNRLEKPVSLGIAGVNRWAEGRPEKDERAFSSVVLNATGMFFQCAIACPLAADTGNTRLKSRTWACWGQR